MLILTRRVGERINIGDEIVLKILEVKGRQVRLGIEAPPSTLIHREEIYDRIKAENLEASEAHVQDLREMDTLLGSDIDSRGKEGYGNRHHEIRDHRDR